ncbi:MAG: DUF2793 domain-containing protein [Oceanicaulis sp.]
MPDTTPRLGLPWLMPAQAQKHVTVNEALGRLDALVAASVESRSLAAQPADPAEGEAYILPAGATGAQWDGFSEHDLAVFQDGAWLRIAPRRGLVVHVADEAGLLVHDGAGWVALFDLIDRLENLQALGVGAAPDANNPFVAKLNTALWTARFEAEGGTGDLRYTLNKEAPGDVLSLLFQSGWSGRAEIGLTGSDDLSVKVSADGSTWTEALTIGRGDGVVGLPMAQIAGGAALGLSALSLAAGGALAFGVSPTDLVRRADLGSAAFADVESVRLSPVRTLSAPATLTPDDLGRVIVQTGAGALTLPAGAGLESGWRTAIKNRSGAAAAVQPGDPSGVIDGGAPGAAVSLPAGQGAVFIHAGSGVWEII